MLTEIKALLRESVPSPQLKRLRRIVRPAWLGTLRRTTPLSRRWGFDRGTPIDRYYIDRSLSRHQDDIRGRVLEVKDNYYARRFGSAITQTDVLDIDDANRRANVITDLARADGVRSNTYDCFILVQTLQFIPDVASAICHAWRILQPGGTLLVTVPLISKVANGPGEDDCWRFTARCCASLFGAQFGSENVEVRSYGNVLAAIAFLAGMAAEELSEAELDCNDDEYPLIISVRARKK